ncbi:MAG: toprim domain-containing protein [Pseudomonadota bacterium]|nr:toprim domain-containing protein [Pseudomonadota bacterium]
MIGAEQFAEEIRRAGLEPPPTIEPGRLHRFSSNGKPGDDGGWCKLFEDCTGGVFGDWRSGLSEVWQAKRERPFSPEEKAAFRAKCEEERRQRKAEEERRQKDAAAKTVAVWGEAEPAREDHPYVKRKQVKPVSTLREIPAEQLANTLGYSPKSRGEPLTGRVLVAPVKVGDKVSTAELIDTNGRKTAIYGGQKAGGYWAAQRLPEDLETLLIGEGVATALSAKEASGHPAVAALSCGNLEAVAKEMRGRYPRAKIVVLADLGNGQEDAESAARAVDGFLALPDPGEDRPEGLLATSTTWPVYVALRASWRPWRRRPRLARRDRIHRCRFGASSDPETPGIRAHPRTAGGGPWRSGECAR